MANNINAGSYATYDGYDELSYLCIKYLMDNDDVVWKLLKYLDRDAWSKPNLTESQKAELIYKGSDDASLYKVFLDSGVPDVITREDCIIRLSPHSIFPENRTIGTVNMVFEVYSHYHINTLSNYKTRIDMITKRFLQVFNGADITGFGKMYFDRMASAQDRLEAGGQLPHKGRWMIMSNKSP